MHPPAIDIRLQTGSARVALLDTVLHLNTTERTASTVELIVIKSRKIENTGIPLLVCMYVPITAHPLIQVILAPHTPSQTLHIHPVIVSGHLLGILVVLPTLPRLPIHPLHLRLPTFHKINFHGINTHLLLLRYPNHIDLTPTPPNNSSFCMR